MKSLPDTWLLCPQLFLTLMEEGGKPRSLQHPPIMDSEGPQRRGTFAGVPGPCWAIRAPRLWSHGGRGSQRAEPCCEH